MEIRQLEIKCKGAAMLPWKAIRPFQGDLKELPEANLLKLVLSIVTLGISEPLSVWGNADGFYAINCHQRLKALEWLSANAYEGIRYEVPPNVPVSYIEAADEAEAKRKVLALTSQFGVITGQGLYDFSIESNIPLAELENFNFPEIDFPAFKESFFPDAGGGGGGDGAPGSRSLADRFIVPPFSVLDTRQAYWRQRREYWMGLGIESEIGRKTNLLGMSKTIQQPDAKKRNSVSEEDVGGTSIFDPVVCELAYKWFAPKGGSVLDPFAGGSVRGIVAAMLGLHYTGCELRAEQVAANNEQADKILQDQPHPLYVTGDSNKTIDEMQNRKFDLVFSCPPYFNLEKYSDDESDLSNMPWIDFKAVYGEIIHKAIARLNEDRFAVWVISDVRAKSGGGFYMGLLQETIRMFDIAGAPLYNEMILLNAVGTQAMRSGRTFSATRKVGRIHQNVLIFCKGDPKKATEALGEIEVELPEAPEDENAEEQQNE